jgi:archaellum component FlaC
MNDTKIDEKLASLIKTVESIENDLAFDRTQSESVKNEIKAIQDRLSSIEAQLPRLSNKIQDGVEKGIMGATRVVKTNTKMDIKSFFKKWRGVNKK